MKPLQLLLRPFSLLYGIAIGARSILYNTGILTSQAYKLPIICVGNLTHGGTGKTPHVKFIAQQLQKKHKLAVLLRGYKRNSSGYLLVEKSTPFNICGDEARQYKQSNPELIVAVDGDRRNGIAQLSSSIEDLDCIIMDDGFQHRRVKPGFSIILRDYNELQSKNYLAPAGTLREPVSAAKRADVIIVSKCPENISKEEKLRLATELKIAHNQSLYFTYVVYDKVMSFNKTKTIDELSEYEIVLFTGIGNAKPLLNYLNNKATRVTHFEFNDHHNFNSEDLAKIDSAFKSIDNEKKIIVTTEKDLNRLDEIKLTEMDVHYIPIAIEFDNDGSTEFMKQLSNFVE